jgi:hypothetical protein
MNHFCISLLFLDLVPINGIVYCFGTEIMKATAGKATKVTRFAKSIISKDRKTNCSGSHRSPISILKKSKYSSSVNLFPSAISCCTNKSIASSNQADTNSETIINCIHTELAQLDFAIVKDFTQ